MAKLKERIVESVDAIYSASNALRSSEFGRIYFWQEVSSLADAKLKESWEQAQKTGIPSDDELRAMPVGDHVVDEDKRFTLVVKISKPRESFDLDMFIAALVKKHKLDPVELRALADRSKKTTKPSLSKKVLEA